MSRSLLGNSDYFLPQQSLIATIGKTEDQNFLSV
jgi:hypothetical protein